MAGIFVRLQRLRIGGVFRGKWPPLSVVSSSSKRHVLSAECKGEERRAVQRGMYDGTLW